MSFIINKILSFVPLSKGSNNMNTFNIGSDYESLESVEKKIRRRFNNFHRKSENSLINRKNN